MNFPLGIIAWKLLVFGCIGSSIFSTLVKNAFLIYIFIYPEKQTEKYILFSYVWEVFILIVYFCKTQKRGLTFVDTKLIYILSHFSPNSYCKLVFKLLHRNWTFSWIEMNKQVKMINMRVYIFTFLFVFDQKEVKYLETDKSFKYPKHL